LEYVVPIKDVEKILAMKKVLKKSSIRDLLLFVLGINTGLKLQDLLHLKVEDVWEGKKMREFLYVKDGKSGEPRAYYLNSKVEEVLNLYMETTDLKPGDYLFKSKKDDLPITRQQAYRIINRAAKEAGIRERIGTHTMRKTFGYHAYRKGIAISILMSIFHHRTKNETMRYIGINEDEQKVIRVDVNL
jgi:Phage integrase family.